MTFRELRRIVRDYFAACELAYRHDDEPYRYASRREWEKAGEKLWRIVSEREQQLRAAVGKR